MCGIFGYIGPSAAAPLLISGLRRLEYRGYDSAGIAVINGDLDIYKKVGMVKELENILPATVKGNIGIAHTRWATHGGVTDANSHPHASEDGKVALVHNGIIENANALRNQLRKRGIVLKSETDSEVLVHMINLEYQSGAAPLTAVRRTLRRARGTWGICVIFLSNDNIVCAGKGSPYFHGI